ncbi:MAG: hypothetical protein Q4E17_05195 [Synergistes sp.]|nr:hypothetical protein [Synergistes sp.]
MFFTGTSAFAGQMGASADILIHRALGKTDDAQSIQNIHQKPAPVVSGTDTQKTTTVYASMPNIYAAALALVNESERESVKTAAEDFYTNGFPEKAASVIGRAIGKECDFSLHRLGTFCLNTLPTAGNFDAQAEFITGFMRGYSNTGLVMFDTAGLKSYGAANLDHTSHWMNVPDGSSSPASNERIYVGKGIVFIPFVYGKSFNVNCVANGKANVRMIKMLPDFVNKRNWGAGVWEKEIKVIAAPRAK